MSPKLSRLLFESAAGAAGSDHIYIIDSDESDHDSDVRQDASQIDNAALNVLPGAAAGKLDSLVTRKKLVRQVVTRKKRGPKPRGTARIIIIIDDSSFSSSSSMIRHQGLIIVFFWVVGSCSGTCCGQGSATQTVKSKH